MDRKYYFCLLILIVQYANCELDESDNLQQNNENELTRINVVRLNRNNVATKLRTYKQLTATRQRLMDIGLMTEKDNFYTCERILSDDDCNFSTVNGEADFKLEDILYNENSIRIGESHLEDFHIFVNVSRPDKTVMFSDRIRLDETLNEIRQKLQSHNLLTEDEAFYQRRTSDDGSFQYSPIISTDEIGMTIKDILFDGSIRVDINSLDVSIIKNYMRNSPVSFRIPMSFIEKRLDKVRENWMQTQRMLESDYFYKQENGVEILIRRDDEKHYTMKDITYDKSVLIGMLVDETKNEELDMVTNLVNANFLKGFSVENTGIWRLTPKTLATLKGVVDVMDSQNSTTFESFFASSQEKLSRMTQGVSETSLSLSASYIFVEASATYEQTNENKQTSSSSSQKSYCITRMACQKKDIDINPARLTIHTDFHQSIRHAISSGRIDIQTAQNLVGVLNEYGWYLPKSYVLGGAKYCTKETSARSEAEGKEESKKFAASVNLAVNFGLLGVNGGVQHSERSQSTTDTERQSETSLEKILTIGGDGQQDFNSFSNALSDPKHWRIIKYETFLPSLSLLVGHDDLAFVQCIKLLTQFYPYPPIKDLQRIVDIRDYALQLDIKYSY